MPLVRNYKEPYHTSIFKQSREDPRKSVAQNTGGRARIVRSGLPSDYIFEPDHTATRVQRVFISACRSYNAINQA
jgi:hypothetical protein